MEQYIFGQVRVQVLDNRVVRIERKSKDKFFDGDTFLVPCHAELCDNAVCSSVDCGNVNVGNYTICLPQDATTIDEVVVYKDGKEVYKCEKTTKAPRFAFFLSLNPVFFRVASGRGHRYTICR